MGSCGSNDGEYDRELRIASDQAKKIHKLLLLGPGSSGKSTFFKQLTQIHGEKYSEIDRQHAVPFIHDSILEQMKSIIYSAYEEFNYTFEEKTEEAAQAILNLDRDTPLNEDVAVHLKQLWGDEKIKKTFEDRTHVGIVDSCPHFFDSLDRIARSDYLPSEEDILLSRTPTTGIRESSFNVKENMFAVYDVGGQRNERQKWIHCFDGVHAVLFVMGLSCYDQMLYEETGVNAMQESLDLWEDVSNSHYFSNKRTSMIIFFNKSDLFEAKVAKKSIKMFFKDYTGQDHSFEESIAFIRTIFLTKVLEKNRQIYTHITNATDRLNVERVFNDVQHSVVLNALTKNGIL